MAKSSRPDEPLVDLGQLLAAVLRSWRWLLLSMGAGLLAGIVYFLVAAPVYYSRSLLSVENEATEGLEALMGGQIGALASLAGLSLGDGAGRRAEYLAVLRSETFALRFLRQHDLVDVLNEKAQQGVVRRVLHAVLRPQKSRRALELQAVRHLHRHVLQVAEDKKTGLVTVQMGWHDPETAARWVDAFVQQFNDEARARDGQSAASRFDFLRREAERNRTREIQSSISKLMESELNKIMVANVQPDYALRVIERASVTPVDQPDRPVLFVAVFLGVFSGLIVGVLAALFRRRAEWWPA